MGEDETIAPVPMEPIADETETENTSVTEEIETVEPVEAPIETPEA